MKKTITKVSQIVYLIGLIALGLFASVAFAICGIEEDDEVSDNEDIPEL